MIQTKGNIAIHCACGSVGSVNGRFAGRKLRCRECQEVLRVPYPVLPVAVTGWDELELLPTPRSSPWRRSPAYGHQRAPRAPEHRRRDFGQEAHVRAIAFWHRLIGTLGVLGAMVALFGVSKVSLGLGLVAFLGVGLCAGSQLALGHGLWTYQGWSRWVAGACAVLGLGGASLSLLLVPGWFSLAGWGLTLLWQGGILWILFGGRGGELFQADYRAAVAHRPQAVVTWWRSPFFFGPFLIVILALVGVACLVAAAL